MSDTSVVSAVHIVATSQEIREKIYPQLVKIVEYTRAEEPETLKYAICVPDDSEQTAVAGTTIYIFEEYKDKDAWSAHMASTPVTDLLKILQAEPATQVDVKHLYWVPGAHFERAPRLPSGSSYDLRDQVEHPFVLWATITDPQTADIDTLAPYGAAVVKYAQANEPNTILYGDMMLKDVTPDDKDDDVKGGFIAALEVYASKAAWVAHLNDDTVKALSAEAGKLDSKFTLVQLNMIEGWLTR